MRRPLTAVVLLWGLSACDPVIRKSEAESIAEDHADAAAAPLRSQIEETDSRVDELEGRIEELEGRIGITSASVSSLRETVNHNARLDNEEAVREMTRKGQCGYEAVTLETGGTVYRPSNARSPICENNLGKIPRHY